MITSQKKLEYIREWKKLNKDKVQEYAKEYNKKWREENKEKARGGQRKWREQHKEYSRQWRELNPEKAREYDHKRCFGSVERWNEGMLKYEGECAFACDRKAELVHHLDGKSRHNSPQEQVNNNLGNLLPLCFSCHTWLHNKTRSKKMRAIKIPFFASGDDIIKLAKKKYGKHKKFAFVEWPDGHPFGSIRLVVMNEEEWEDFNED